MTLLNQISIAQSNIMQNADEAKNLSDYIYNPDTKQSLIPQGWTKIAKFDSNIAGTNTGLYAEAFEKDGKVIIVSRGTDNPPDINSDAQMILDKKPAQYDDLNNFYNSLKNDPNGDKLAGKEVIFAGHSLGGSLSQLMAASTGKEAITFNAYGTEPLMSVIGQSSDASVYSNRVINYVVSSDLVGNAGTQIGKTFYVANPNQNFFNTINSLGANPMTGLTSAYYHVLDSHALSNFNGYNLENPGLDSHITDIQSAESKIINALGEGARTLASQNNGSYNFNASVTGNDQNATVELTNTQCTYTVQKGDTVWDIAQKYGRSVEDILNNNSWLNNRYNDDKSVLLIKPGEQILIPDQAQTSVTGRIIFGGSADETIDTTGLSGDKYIFSGSGNDTIRLYDGNNSVYAGFGDDRVYAGTGNDYIDAGSGNDLVSGGSGNDYMVGGYGTDTLYGDNGNDFVLGGEGNDSINGGLGDDLLSGGNGADNFIGDYGNDNIYGDAGNDIIYSGSGDDYLDGGLGDDLSSGWYGNDTIEDYSGNNTMYGDYDNDKIYGGSGTDYINGGLGDDLLSGGDNNDTLIGDYGNDQLYGDNGNDQLFGGDGADYLNGGLGDDLLSGWYGNDTLIGDYGNDSLYGDWDNDYLDGGGNNDLLNGGLGDDTLKDSAGVNTFQGDAGQDNIYSYNPADKIYYDPNDKIYTTYPYTPPVPPPSSHKKSWFARIFGAVAAVVGGYFLGGGTLAWKSTSAVIVNPLVLDLNGNGIETKDINNSNVYFDMDGDGIKEKTGWLSGNDGFLVIDKNNNGQIDSINEMFGKNRGFDKDLNGKIDDIDELYRYGDLNGFQELKQLDSNNDNIIDSKDSQFASLKVWQDSNEDGITDEGELKTLTQAGIQSINLNYINNFSVNNNNYISHTSTYIKTDGTQAIAANANFQVNDTMKCNTPLTDTDMNRIIQEMTTYTVNQGIQLTGLDDTMNNQQLINIMTNSWHQ